MNIDLSQTYMDLGGIIARLEREDPERVLPLGFADPHSFRGYYDQLAFERERARLIALRDRISRLRKGGEL